MPTPRSIRLTLPTSTQSEGSGALVRRSIGTPSLPNLTPFLLLDHFTVQPPAGFPDHPHRGQETITYLLHGAVDHEDFTGHRGTIWPGDLQFMTAGRGIMHAEMPHISDTEGVGDPPAPSPAIGIQLWVDLAERLKGIEPRYRDLRAAEIPTATAPDARVRVKVISGRSLGVDSVRDLTYTPVWMLDVTVQPGGKLTQELPKGWNAFAYTLAGVVSFQDGVEDGAARAVAPWHNVVFENDGVADVVVAGVEEGGEEEARFILCAGLPLEQRVVQRGPFVLGSAEGVMEAMRDFQSHANGFERARGWRSEIGNRVLG